jgi:hypothetical protein
MNHSRLARALIILLFILVSVTFFTGTLRTFALARAAPVLDERDANTGLQLAEVVAITVTSTTSFLTPGSTPIPPVATVLASPTPVETIEATPAPTPTPTATPVPEPEYITDMTGILALGILLVVVILVGITWGAASTRKKRKGK